MADAFGVLDIVIPGLGDGNEYLCVDEDMRLRLETKLICSIVTGFRVLMA